MAVTRTICFCLFGAALCVAHAETVLRPPVHPRRNVEDFPAVPAKYIRFTILKASSAQPCLDELEVFSGDEATRNLALASAGARATASGSLPGYQIHQLEFVNDNRGASKNRMLIIRFYFPPLPSADHPHACGENHSVRVLCD